MTLKKDIVGELYHCRNNWCNKTFTTADVRTRHEKRNCYRPSRRFTCKGCGKWFNTRKGLSNHKRSCYWIVNVDYSKASKKRKIKKGRFVEYKVKKSFSRLEGNLMECVVCGYETRDRRNMFKHLCAKKYRNESGIKTTELKNNR